MLRPLYESSAMLAHKTTMAVRVCSYLHCGYQDDEQHNDICFVSFQALCHLRQIAQEVSQPNLTNSGRRPAALRALRQRLSR